MWQKAKDQQQSAKPLCKPNCKPNSKQLSCQKRFAPWQRQTTSRQRSRGGKTHSRSQQSELNKGKNGDCSGGAGARGRERALAAVGVWLQPPTTPRPSWNPLRNGGPSWGNPLPPRHLPLRLRPRSRLVFHLAPLRPRFKPPRRLSGNT